MSDTTGYEQLAEVWERSLNADPAMFTDADYTVSACLADLRYVIANGTLPQWYPPDHNNETDHLNRVPGVDGAS